MHDSTAVSEWLFANTGVLRSQHTGQAVKQLLSTVLDIISYYESHRELSQLPHLLPKVQELCIPVVTNPAVLPLVEALFKPYRPWKGMSLFTLTNDQVSPKFLETITHLQRPVGRYDNPPKLSLSYNARVTLWTMHTPALKQELLDITEACLPWSDVSSIALLHTRDFPKACYIYPELLSYSEQYFRGLAENTTSKILQILHREVSNFKAEEAFKDEIQEHTYAIHLPCLHI